MKNFMDARVKELIAMGATFPEAHAAALAEWNTMNGKAVKARKGTGKAAPAVELVEFKKQDGTVVKCTPKQAAAWEKWRSREHKPLDEVKAEYEAKHTAYKPTDELIAALKAKPTMTRKEAKAYGFIGTKDELKALKLAHKVYDK